MSAASLAALALLAAAAPPPAAAPAAPIVAPLPAAAPAAAPAVRPAAAVDTSLPFPAPRLVAVSSATRCDWGTIVSVDVAAQTMVVVMPVGNVTYRVGPEALVVSADGKVQSDGLRVLGPGLKVRVYYVVDEGAKAAEVDLE